jgi:30S ribosomal protein S31
MGKGDIKSKKGKIANGSFGKSRPHKIAKKVEAETKKASK